MPVDLIFAAVWFLSMAVCLATIGGALEREFPDQKLEYLDRVIGSYAATPVIAGFSVFPIINTAIAIWIIHRHCRGCGQPNKPKPPSGRQANQQRRYPKSMMFTKPDMAAAADTWGNALRPPCENPRTDRS